MSDLTNKFQAIEQTLNNMVLMALASKAVSVLQTLKGTEDNYRGEILMARFVLSASPHQVGFVTRALVSAGFDKNSTDKQITDALDANWSNLAKLYDPTLEA